jgi:hypothetical protein
MIRSRRAARLTQALLSTLALLAACSDTAQPPDPTSFQRANRVAFVCVDLTLPIGVEESLVPLERCYPDPAGEETGYGLHALVLQSSRGELAAVDVRNWRVMDSRNDIPGKTFVPVGAVPVAVVTAPDHPRFTYVANSGSRDISVLRTASTMLLAPGQSATLQQVALRLPDSDATQEAYDMVLAPDQDALFVSSRVGGWLMRIPIQRCEDGTETCEGAGRLDEAGIARIPLEESWAKLPAEALDPAAAVSSEEPYRYTCELNPPLLMTPTVPPDLPSAGDDVGAPEPAGLAIDAFCAAGSCTRRLLVADAQQPIVHAIDLDKLSGESLPAAILEPILTAAPTERVAVTPRVPVDLESDEETQYVYAIDARDGSVVVTQNGRILNVGVDPSRRPDRVDLGPTVSTPSVVALSLEVLTPRFDAQGSASQWVSRVENPKSDSAPLECVDNLHQGRASERLRGVFLAVGASDGTVRFINVHDMELRECRSCIVGENPSYSPFRPGYDPLPVVRNHARLLTYVTDDRSATPVIAPVAVPQFVVAGAAIGVKSDGTTNDTRVAGLDCITCADDQAVSFPPEDVSDDGTATPTTDAGTPETVACTQGQGRICSKADPYVEPRNWQAVYEGGIPGTLGGRGRFVPRSSPDNQTGALEFAGDSSFCEVGVLGDDVLGVGDQLVITAPLPTEALRSELDRDCPGCFELSQSESDLCNTLVDARSANDNLIAFGIRRAFAGRVQVTTELVQPRAVKATWEQVVKCFAGLPLTYQVHSRESFIVRDLGNIGFRHRVIAEADTGRCVLDETQDPKRTSRVRKGELYDNGLIAFQPRDGSFAPLTVLNIASGSNAPKLLLRAADSTGTTGWQGVMPVDLRFSPTDQRLYIVDSTVRGLMRISLDPVRSTVSAIDTIQ